VRHRTHTHHPYVFALLGMLPALAGASCDWSRPGSAPYRGLGDVTAAQAVDSYTDMPAAVREELKTRIRGQREDAHLLITRDQLHSPQGVATALRDMHWRDGLCRGAVSRAGWAPGHVEAALVYCSGGHCVAVPTVCGNVARVSFEPHPRRQAQLQHWGVAPGGPNQVPEPSTFALVAVALFARVLQVVSSRVRHSGASSAPGLRAWGTFFSTR
jgi:hypothetical protein